MNLHSLWHRLHVSRWHTNAHMHRCGDTTAAHSARMATLALRLWPGDLELCAACVVHDAGEWATGDAPWDAKRSSPMLKAISDKREADAIDSMGLDGYDTHDPRVTLLDRLDAYAMAALHRPDQLEAQEWSEARAEI